jgi:hypothetical protein
MPSPPPKVPGFGVRRPLSSTPSLPIVAISIRVIGRSDSVVIRSTSQASRAKRRGTGRHFRKKVNSRGLSPRTSAAQSRPSMLLSTMICLRARSSSGGNVGNNSASSRTIDQQFASERSNPKADYMKLAVFCSRAGLVARNSRRLWRGSCAWPQPSRVSRVSRMSRMGEPGSAEPCIRSLLTMDKLRQTSLKSLHFLALGFSTGRFCTCLNAHKTIDSTAYNHVLEARVGIEPTNAAFAEPCLTTWLPRPRSGKDEATRAGAQVFTWATRLKNRTVCVSPTTRPASRRIRTSPNSGTAFISTTLRPLPVNRTMRALLLSQRFFAAAN